MRRHLMLLFTLAAKDWTLFWADRRAALLCFAVPIVLASGFGLVFDRGPGGGAPKLPLLVVTSKTTRRSPGRLRPTSLPGREWRRSRWRAWPRRRRGWLTGGRGWRWCCRLGSEPWPTGRRGSGPADRGVRVIHNPLCASEGQWAEGVVTEVVMRRLAKTRLGVLIAAGGTDPVTLPFAVDTAPVAASHHQGFNAYSHSFCGMTLQYLLFWGMESGLLLLRERQRSLWPRLRAAPVPLWCLLLGKAVATAAVAMLQVLVTFGFGYVAFGVTVTGSWAGFLLLAAAASAASAATGLMVAAVGGTEARARSVCILVILGVSMLGGLWLPAFVLPGWARDVALGLPTTWAMRGLDGVTWQGRDFVAVLPAAGAVAGFAAVFLAVAVAKLVSSEARRRRGVL